MEIIAFQYDGMGALRLFFFLSALPFLNAVLDRSLSPASVASNIFFFWSIRVVFVSFGRASCDERTLPSPPAMWSQCCQTRHAIHSGWIQFDSICVCDSALQERGACDSRPPSLACHGLSPSHATHHRMPHVLSQLLEVETYLTNNKNSIKKTHFLCVLLCMHMGAWHPLLFAINVVFGCGCCYPWCFWPQWIR